MRKNVAVLFLVLVFVAAGSMVASTARANTFNVNLSGTVSNAFSNSWTTGSDHIDYWRLPLSGLQVAPITVSQFDVINATIQLDQSFTMPASVTRTSFVVYLTGPSFPAGNTGTGGTTTFFNSGSAVASGSASTGTSGWLANSVDFYPPENVAITFDSLASDFTIVVLSGQATLEFAQMSYFLYSPAAPVPVPPTLLLFGPGLVGLAAIRRRFKK